MPAGQKTVTLSTSAIKEASIDPAACPRTLTPENTVRLGVKVQRYLAEAFGLGDGALPDRLPHEAQVALARAVPFAEASNEAAGKTGKNAIIFTADLAQALGADPHAAERRYGVHASRFK